ncbi:MAG: aminodeoxychorismate/anthranilate synthase component II [Acidobacteriota bacterium]
MIYENSQAPDSRVLVIDNYDSFTFNLVQMLVVQAGRVEVVRNDQLTCDDVLSNPPDALLISPGPGRPEDAGICVELLQREAAVPMLGVCLGHQALGLAFGGRVERAPELMHGKTSRVEHRGTRLFDGLSSPFEATRYHSLCVAPGTLGDDLEPLAWSEDGVLQAMRHRRLPYWGVQFHPESILTEVGPQMLGNFLEIAAGEPG